MVIQKTVICSRPCVLLHPVCKILLLQFVSCIYFHRPAMNFTRNLQVISPVPKIGPNCIYFIYDKCLLFLWVSVDGGITVFTGSLFQCLIILAIRKFVLISSQNYPCCILSLCPLCCSHGEQTFFFLRILLTLCMHEGCCSLFFQAKHANLFILSGHKRIGGIGRK